MKKKAKERSSHLLHISMKENAANNNDILVQAAPWKGPLPSALCMDTQTCVQEFNHRVDISRCYEAMTVECYRGVIEGATCKQHTYSLSWSISEVL